MSKEKIISDLNEIFTSLKYYKSPLDYEIASSFLDKNLIINNLDELFKGKKCIDEEEINDDESSTPQSIEIYDFDGPVLQEH